MKENPTVLITGGTSGIGHELAKIFAANGYNLILVARTREDLRSVSQEIGQQFGVMVNIFNKDLHEPDAPFELYRELKEQNLPVDILVNNAGQGHYGEFVEVDLIKDIEIIELNILALVILTKLFLQDMAERGAGKILNLSSVASRYPGPLQSVYHGTKAFVQSFSEALHNEMKDKGITVTALLPGPTDTDFFRKAGMLEAKNVVEGDLGDPAKVAKDGFDALMAGDDMVISGLRNKVQAGMGKLMSDSMKANQVHQQQKPVKDISQTP